VVAVSKAKVCGVGGGGVTLAEGYESIVHKKREYDIPKGVVYLAGGIFLGQITWN
jgi:hypothetical protein